MENTVQVFGLSDSQDYLFGSWIKFRVVSIAWVHDITSDMWKWVFIVNFGILK